MRGLQPLLPRLPGAGLHQHGRSRHRPAAGQLEPRSAQPAASAGFGAGLTPGIVWFAVSTIDAGSAAFAAAAEPSTRNVSAGIAIDMRGLSLTFQTADAPVVALDDINLTIRRGEFVSLIGPSGCGKTTLLRVIADLEAPSAGHIAVNGVSALAARLDRAYGYVFQAPALYAWRAVLRNVMRPLEVIGVPGSQRKASAARYLSMV